MAGGAVHRSTIRVNFRHEQRFSAPRHHDLASHGGRPAGRNRAPQARLLYTSDAAAERSSVDLGGPRIL